MDHEFKTVIIPAEGEENKIGMDTHQHREGLHMWIGKHVEYECEDGSNKTRFDSRSVHLTREDARNLIREIQRRLF